MEDTLNQVWTILVEIVTNLLNPDAWRRVLEKPEVFWAAFIAVTLIVFTETGLLVGFFLPGDSLLVTVGMVAHSVNWPIEYLIPALWAAAILGDSCGYLIGRTFGPRLFKKEKSFFFRKDYLLAAQAYYEEHGAKTIIVAKFVPFLRTFAPVVAGAARMPYRRFVTFSVVGVLGWITSMILLGYTLHLWLEPILGRIFGRRVEVARNIDKVIVVVVLVSVLPILFKGGKKYLAQRRAAKQGAGQPPVPMA
jgi:membrane-associated protein